MATNAEFIIQTQKMAAQSVSYVRQLTSGRRTSGNEGWLTTKLVALRPDQAVPTWPQPHPSWLKSIT